MVIRGNHWRNRIYVNCEPFRAKLIIGRTENFASSACLHACLFARLSVHSHISTSPNRNAMGIIQDFHLDKYTDVISKIVRQIFLFAEIFRI